MFLNKNTFYLDIWLLGKSEAFVNEQYYEVHILYIVTFCCNARTRNVKRRFPFILLMQSSN